MAELLPVDTEISTLRNRVQQLAATVENLYRQLKAKDAHLVSNAYHLSSVENNTSSSLADLKQRLNLLESNNTQTVRDLSSVSAMISVLRQDQTRLLTTHNDNNRQLESKIEKISAKYKVDGNVTKMNDGRNFDEFFIKLTYWNQI